MSKELERQVAELLEIAEPTPQHSAAYRARALAAMQQAGGRHDEKQARRITLRVAIAAGAICFALFLAAVVVTAPARSARALLREKLEAALAAAESAQTAHVIIRPQYADDPDHRMESWYSVADGFHRVETRSAGHISKPDPSTGVQLVNYAGISTTVVNGAWVITYWQGANARAFATFEPSLLDRTPTTLSWLVKNSVDVLDQSVEDLRMALEQKANVEVVEVTGKASGVLLTGADSPFAEGDPVRARFEVYRATGQLISYALYYRKDGWKLLSESHYEWNVPIEESLRTLEIPPDVPVERDTWWEKRVSQKLAEAETKDWNVEAHAVDLANDGSIYLSVKRSIRNQNRWGDNQGYGLMLARATDDAGGSYEADRDRRFRETAGYIVLRLEPLRAPARQPESLTVKIYPYSAEPFEAQNVTLTLPIPPPTELEDPIKFRP